MDIIEVQDWISKSDADYLVQIPNSPVSAQLERLEDIGSGVGFVFVLAPMVKENVLALTTDDEGDKQIHHEMISYPVMRLGWKWYTTTDENFADIIGAMIRIVTSGASGE